MANRRLFVILVGAAVIFTAVLGYIYWQFNGPNPAGGIAIGGPIHLTNQDGGKFDSASLSGKPYAVFFGFTNCPEVCPTTLSDITQATDAIGDRANGFTTLFVTIDPERDTVPVLKEYLTNFRGNIVGLTGTLAEVDTVAKEFRVFYEKIPTSDGGYTMNHTAVLYLMDRKGSFRGIINYDEDHEQYVKKIGDLLNN